MENHPFLLIKHNFKHLSMNDIPASLDKYNPSNAIGAGAEEIQRCRWPLCGDWQAWRVECWGGGGMDGLYDWRVEKWEKWLKVTHISETILFFRVAPSRSGAASTPGSGQGSWGFQCRYLVRFRRVPVKIPAEAPEGSVRFRRVPVQIPCEVPGRYSVRFRRLTVQILG